MRRLRARPWVSGSWKDQVRGAKIECAGRFKKCFTCLQMLGIRKFNIEKKSPDGRAEMCFECVKTITGRTKNRQKKKRLTKTEQSRRERHRFARHVWIFPGGFTFPRAEMFLPGETLGQTFERASIKKVRTSRKV